MAHDKRVLRELAKRWAKGVLLGSIGSEAFMAAGLTDDQEQEVWDEVHRIAERITKLPAPVDTNSLVDEYFDPA